MFKGKDKSEGFVFVDMKVPVFVNKKNGQLSLTLPKKQVKKLHGGRVPDFKEVKISLWKNVN